MANSKKRKKIIIFSIIGVTVLGLTLAAIFRKKDPVVTVQTVGAEPQAFQAADPAEVRVLAAGEQVEPTTTNLPETALAETGSDTPAQLIAAGLALAIGSLVLVIGRRRRTN